jgi:glycosyltransferase involved in cell wall biosynthesis
VVATDCASGPRQILQDGRYGPLVPVGDEQALAAAMNAVLEKPLPADELRAATRCYQVAAATRAYMQALGVAPPGQGT